MMDDETLRRIQVHIDVIHALIPLRTFHEKNFEYAKQHLAEAYFWFSTTRRKEGA